VDNVTGAEYVTAAGGGVWKSLDSGNTWAPLTFNQATLDMSAIALAPNGSLPEIIYAATGDIDGNAGFRNYSTYGIGILKSMDGGQSWTLLTGQMSGNPNANVFNRRTISKLVVDPTNPNTVYAAVYGGGDNGSIGNTGIWKSTDAGVTWVNTTSSIDTFDSWSDLAIDPANSQILYAAVGTSNGSAFNGVYMTTTGGTGNHPWTLVSALPSGFTKDAAGNSIGRISLGIGTNDPLRVYVLMSDTTGALYSGGLYGMWARQDNGAWTNLSASPNLTLVASEPQLKYGNVIAVDPLNSQIVYAFGSICAVASKDGGSTWQRINYVGPPLNNNPSFLARPHDDYHASVFYGGNGATGSGPLKLLVGNDGGIWRLENPETDFGPFSNPPNPQMPQWTCINGDLGITQFYNVALDPNSASNAYGASQDNGISQFQGNPNWSSYTGGDAFNLAVSPNLPNTVYSSGDGQNGKGLVARNLMAIDSSSLITGGYFIVDPNKYPSGQDRLLFAGSDIVESTDSGNNWNSIMGTGWPVDGNGNSLIAVINYDLSASHPDTIYAVGQNSGSRAYLTLVTVDDGQHWAALAPPPDASALQSYFSQSNLHVDPVNDHLVYVVGNDGHVYQGQLTTDASGQPTNLTWQDITGSGLPTSPIDGRPASLYAIAVYPLGPQDRDLYVGTDFGVYTSNNDGATWCNFGALPNARVVDLQMQNYPPSVIAGGPTAPNIFAAGTYGIGMWEIAFGVTAVVVNGNLEITGDAGDDVITVRLNPNDPSKMEVWEGGPENAFDQLVGSFAVSTLTSVTITTGNCDNTVNVEDSVAGIPVTVNAGTGTDIVNISPFDQTLTNIQANVSVNGTGAGLKTLNVDDQQAQLFLVQYTVTSSTIDRGTGIISYNGFRAVNLNGNVSAIYNVLSTEPFWTTTLNTGGGLATVNVLAAGFDGTLNIVGNGGSNADVVNLGDNGLLTGVQSAVNIENKSSTTAVNIDDSQDPAAVNVTLGTFGTNPADAEGDGDIWGGIGFSNGAADIYYEYNDTRSLTIDTGTGAGTVVNVDDTDPAFANFQTSIVSHAPTTINVGNNTSTVQGIASTLNLENPPSLDTINIDDALDSSVQKVVLSTLGTNPADSEGNSDVWGQVSFLGAANINYEYSDTSVLNLLTGTGAGTVVNVLATNSANLGCQTNIVASAKTTVNVGNAGAGTDAQNIASDLNIENPFIAAVSIMVDDSLDPAAQSATLSMLGSNPADSQGNSDVWGQIHALAPANINYEYADISSLQILGGLGGDTYNVANLPLVPTTLSGTAGSNTLHGPNQANSWVLNAAHGGVLDGKITFSGFQNLAGGNVGDTFSLTSVSPITMNLLLNSAGMLTTASGTKSITGNINNNGNLVTVAGAGSTTIQGVISGAGGLNLPGTGTLTLPVANSYSGGTVLNGATLAVGNGGALGSGTLALDSGTLRANGSAVSLSNSVTLAGNVTLGGNLGLTFTGSATLTGNRTLTVTNTATTTFAGVIGQSSNGLGFTKAGSGVLVLSNSNTYSGATTLSAGTLALGNNNALGTGTLILNTGTLQASGAAINIANAVTIAANSTIGGSLNFTFSGPATLTGTRTLTVSNTGTTTFAGAIGQSSNGFGLTKAGGGMLVLSNINTYNGTTTLSAGTLAAGNNNALGTGTLTLNGGTLRADGAAVSLANVVTIAANSTIGGSLNVTFTGATTLTGTETLTVSNTGTTTFAGAIGQSSSGFGLTKAGAGLLILSNSNTYSGITTLSSGTLAAGNNSALGTGTLTLNGGTLRADGAAVSLANAVTIAANSTIAGSLNLTLTGSTSLTGTRTLTVTNTATTTFAGAIGQSSSGFGLTKTGPGILVLSNSNTYSGNTTLSAGILALGNNNALGTGTLILNSGTLEASGAAVALTNAVTLGGNVTIAGSLDLTFDGFATLTGSRTLTVSNTGTTTFAGSIGQSSSGFGLTKTGPGILVLSNSNTYSGNTTLSAGILALGSNNALGTGTLILTTGTLQASGAAVALTNAVTLGGSVTIAGSLDLTFNGSTTLTGNRTLTVTNTGTTTFAGAIGQSSSGLSLTKSGAGKLVLAASNTYTGLTTVSAGTLLVNGSIPGAVSVSGGTLGGSGQTGAVTVKSTGTLLPGSSPSQTAILATGNLALNSGSNFTVALNGTTAGVGGYDQVNVTGTVNVTGSNLNVTVGYAAAIGDSYVIINNDGVDPVVGTFNNLAEGAKFVINGTTFKITYKGGTGNDVVITRIA